ncbi:MAG: helix-turn-helix transcriptional regulator [Oscillospiraceae bacterium]|nr:helix-turn-helix transcriptional regulator [Oscillospiraceae bacterium]
MSELQDYLREQMKDPEFAVDYAKLRPEYEAIRAVIRARLESRMTQKELAEKTGIRQSNISRIENGTSSPTVDTLARLAAGMGKVLKIEFVPDTHTG